MTTRTKYAIYDAERRMYVTASGSLTATRFLAAIFDEPHEARAFARKKTIPEDTLIVVW